MLTTSFKLLHDAHACTERYTHLARALGGIRKYGRTKLIPIARILETNGLDDALWALQTVPSEQATERDRLARLFACWCARQVWHLLTDERSRCAVEVAERYAVGEATADELDAAESAAWSAADAAGRAAESAAWSAADAAWSAADAAWSAARSAAWSAADAAWSAADAAWSAARSAAWSAADAARSAARAAAWAAAWAAQAAHLRAMLEEADDAVC